MKRKVLSTALATTLILASVVPSFAEGMVVPEVSPIKNEKPSIVYQNVKGTQKALCIMVNLKENPFSEKHNEEFYYNEFFSEDAYSVASYIEHESNGKFRVKPADTKGTKYPGVVKVDIDGSKYGTIGASYECDRRKSEFFYDVMSAVKDKVNWAAIDIDKDEEFVHSSDNLLRELQITMVVSGSVDHPDSTRSGRIQFWPRCERHVGCFNDYYISTLGATTSEYVENYEASAPIFSHEFLHNLNAKDMYLDRDSIGVWSIMCYHNVNNNKVGKNTPAQLDPMHKMYFGWSKPVKVHPKPGQTIKVNRNEVPYIVGSDGIYVLDYRDSKDAYKVNELKDDRLLVWKVNKDVAIRDWDSYSGTASGGTVILEDFVNSFGAGSSMRVVNYSGTPIGSSISVGGVTVEIGDHTLTVTE